MRHTAVADVMSTNVISASPQDSFSQLASMLHSAAIRAVPVVDAGGTLLGVVSEAGRCRSGWPRVRSRSRGRT
jgi:CBS-domain-containing membrane protein